MEFNRSPFRPASSRYRLPSEDDDVFSLLPLPTFRVKRDRLVSDDDVFFHPRARLSSSTTPLFPRARLPSASESSIFVPRHRRFRERERVSMQIPRESCSIQLSSSQYTADDTPDVAFKTPHTRPLRRRSSDVSSLVPDSTRHSSSGSLSSGPVPSLQDPPHLTRTPFAWISPNVSGILCPPNAVSMSAESINDIRLCLFRQATSTSISPPESRAPAPITSSPQEPDVPTNLALSILQEEMKSDSGFSSLPSFDGQTSYDIYQKDFEDRLADMMGEILTSVEAGISPVQSQDHPVAGIKTSLSAVTEVSPPLVELPDWSSHLPSPTEVSLYPAATISPLSLLLSFHDLDTSLTSSDTATHLISATHLTSSDFSGQSSGSRTKKPVPCPVCYKVLASKGSLKVHMRCHTGEKPYVCPFCSRSFSDRTSFRRHKTLHTGKLFKCVHCDKTYTSSRDLRKHLQRHH